MNIKQIEYFITSAYSNSLNEAAGKLYITQPTLSASLNSLEKELNLILFDRQKRGINLTADGLSFLCEAQKMLTSYQNMLNIAGNDHLSVTGSVNIFGIPQINTNILLPIIKIAIKNYPHIKLEIIESDNSTAKINELKDNELFLGIYADNALNKVLEQVSCCSEIIFHEQSYLYLSTENPFAKFNNLSLSDLSRFSFAMLNFTDRYDVFPYGELVKYFHPELTYRFPTNESILDVICENPNMIGLHSCLLKLNPFYAKKRVAALSIKDFPMPISIVMFSSPQSSPALDIVKNLIRYQATKLQYQLADI